MAFDFANVDYTKGPDGEKLTERNGEEKQRVAGEPMPVLVRFVEQGYYVENKLTPEEVAYNASMLFTPHFYSRYPKAASIYKKLKQALHNKKERFVQSADVRSRPDITDFRFVGTTTDQQKAEAWIDLWWYGRIPANFEFLAEGKPIDANKGFVRHGRTRGEFVVRDEARIAYESYWFNGKRHGTEKTFYVDGQPAFSGVFLNGKPVGKHTNSTVSEINYDENGLKEGTAILWHSKGVKSEEGTYKADKKIGVWTTWYINGKKASTATYLNGVLHGANIVYNQATGLISSTDQWANGQRHGLSRTYRPDGSVETETRYVNGMRRD